MIWCVVIVTSSPEQQVSFRESNSVAMTSNVGQSRASGARVTQDRPSKKDEKKKPKAGDGADKKGRATNGHSSRPRHLQRGVAAERSTSGTMCLEALRRP